MSKRFRTKEELNFYVNTFNLINYKCKNLIISDSSIKIKIEHLQNEYELNIQNYKFGIINLSFDLIDKTIKYKNSVDIGESLEIKPFDSVENLNDKIILITSDDKEEKNLLNKEKEKNDNLNKYKLIIYFDNFLIEYYINNKLLFTLNSKNRLNLLNIEKDNLTSNVFDFEFKNMNKCFGIPERSSSFFLQDDTYRLFNCDHPEQIPYENQCTYGSIPILYGINKDYIISLFNHNFSDQFITIKTEDNNNKNITWISEGGIINLYLFSDDNYLRNFQKFSMISGFSPMPPLWAFGYHHCRWGFKNDKDINDVITNFDKFNIPFDCFWLDIDHTDDKRYFTWDKNNFGNIKEFLDKIKEKNRFFVTIIDPHIKKDEENYKICKKLLDNNCLVKMKNKEGLLINYVGYCWPGNSYYGDFLNYDLLLKNYSEFFKEDDYYLGFNNFGTWVDMNEPSVFYDNNNIHDYSMPPDNIHFDGKKKVQHYEIHNIYGYYYQKVIFNSIKSRFEYKKLNQRPFTLSRSFYAGNQKHGWIWTGDQKATIEFMNLSIETNLVNGLCGISGCGTDVGGFMNNPTEELMKAWFNLGNLYIFFRGHSAWDTIRREPWLFSEETMNSIIESIKFRYHLLLFFYTKFFEHTQNGIPILKPIFLIFREFFEDFIRDNKQGSIFVIGNELIGINHYYLNQESVNILNKIKSPLMYDIFTGEIKNEKFKIDKKLFTEKIIISGNILPWNEKIEFCSFNVLRSPLSIKFYLNENKIAKGFVYFDDGISEKNNGNFLYIEVIFNNGKINCINKNIINDKNFEEIISVYNKFEIYGFKKVEKCVLNNKKEINVEYKQENNLIIINLENMNIRLNNNIEIILE